MNVLLTGYFGNRGLFTSSISSAWRLRTLNSADSSGAEGFDLYYSRAAYASCASSADNAHPARAILSNVENAYLLVRTR